MLWVKYEQYLKNVSWKKCVFGLAKQFYVLTEQGLISMSFLLHWSQEEITSLHAPILIVRDKVKTQSKCIRDPDKTKTLNTCSRERTWESYNTAGQVRLYDEIDKSKINFIC